MTIFFKFPSHLFFTEWKNCIILLAKSISLSSVFYLCLFSDAVTQLLNRLKKGKSQISESQIFETFKKILKN